MEIKTLRSKTVEVLAVRWPGSGVTAAAETIDTILRAGGIASLECVTTPCSGGIESHYLTVHTPSGIQRVAVGEWVFRSAEGAFSIVSDDEVESGYEEVT